MGALESGAEGLYGRSQCHRAGTHFALLHSFTLCVALHSVALFNFYFLLCTFPFLLFTLHFSLFTLHFALFTIHFALCTYHFSLCTLTFHFDFSLCTLHFDFALLQFALFSAFTEHLLCTSCPQPPYQLPIPHRLQLQPYLKPTVVACASFCASLAVRTVQ